MVLAFNYSVLIAIPDRSRGERINVGMVVFLPERIDVRVTDLGKMRALTGHDWTDSANSLARLIQEQYSAIPIDALKSGLARNIDGVFELSELGSFNLQDASAYEAQVLEIQRSLVSRPHAERSAAKGARINTEIARHFRKLRMMARGGETDLATHKVIRYFPLENGLRADFAQQNGSLRVGVSLDLRKEHPDIKDAAVKALTLDRARAIYEGDAIRIGVFAAHDLSSREVKAQVELLKDYSNKVFNWENYDDKARLTNYIADGLGVMGPLV